MCPPKFTFAMNARRVVINGDITNLEWPQCHTVITLISYKSGFYTERENNSNHLIPAELDIIPNDFKKMFQTKVVWFRGGHKMTFLMHTKAQKCQVSSDSTAQMRLFVYDNSFVIYSCFALDAHMYYRTPVRENLEIIRDRHVGSWDICDVGNGIPFDEVSPVECVPFVDNSQTMFRKIREIRLSHSGKQTRRKEALAA
ncbi:hypothetical protein EAG_00714 [Camponotus floridanus]|uniref:Uncharacterized protein n=1 Tax=Camponotus floridanus TaxID=104421 RepID=E2AU62_CAMFO|nr:hypothetical protein EAG_00714 [Camponotus floridanus]